MEGETTEKKIVEIAVDAKDAGSADEPESEWNTLVESMCLGVRDYIGGDTFKKNVSRARAMRRTVMLTRCSMLAVVALELVALPMSPIVVGLLFEHPTEDCLAMCTAALYCALSSLLVSLCAFWLLGAAARRIFRVRADSAPKLHHIVSDYIAKPNFEGKRLSDMIDMLKEKTRGVESPAFRIEKSYRASVVCQALRVLFPLLKSIALGAHVFVLLLVAPQFMLKWSDRYVATTASVFMAIVVSCAAAEVCAWILLTAAHFFLIGRSRSECDESELE